MHLRCIWVSIGFCVGDWFADARTLAGLVSGYTCLGMWSYMPFGLFGTILLSS